jgi:hypothetical protein
MGTMNFLLPADLPAEASQALLRACVVGGPDTMPWPTEVILDANQMSVRRAVDESGSVCVPWEVNGNGRLMLSTATLVERAAPYHLVVELLRGKVNVLRNQTADWLMGGLQLTPALDQKLRQVNLDFARSLSQMTLEQAGQVAGKALSQAVATGNELMEAYIAQVFQARLARQHRLDTKLSCGLHGRPPDAEATQLLRQTFNAVRIAFDWPAIEPTESTYVWDQVDALVAWAKENQFPIVAGPLIDFSRGRLPEWLWLWEKDPQSLVGFMAQYVATALYRYRQDIRVWQITAASNWASLLSLEEDDFLQLTAQLLDVGRRIDANLDLVLGLAQPWGDYLAREDRAYSPFVFADTLIRSRIPVSSLDLELIMGVEPRGIHARDLLDVSRLLDLYAVLGLPVRITLACPSRTTADPRADPTLQVLSRSQQLEWSPDTQATWARAFAALALCKPQVHAVTWAHFSDAEPHQLPHCGLLDETNTPKPALAGLHDLRERYLR